MFSSVEIESSLFKLTKGKNSNKNTIKLIVNNIQASVLNIFNNLKNESISLYEITKELKIPLEILKVNLESLIFEKNTNILLKNKQEISNFDNSNSLSIEDYISLNENFFTNEKILRFLYLNQNENIVQKEKFEGEKSYAIEANIVRVLKTYKRMNIHELMEKVIKAIEIFKISISVRIYFFIIFLGCSEESRQFN